MVARKIVITSGKGGVGKTTVTANLGRALARLGQRVVLIDVDFGLNNLDVVMGLENKIMYDLTDVICGKCRLKQALVQDNVYNNLFLLPSGNYEAYSSISGQNVKLIIESLASVFDYVLIDCPAGIDIGFHRAVASATEGIVVVTPNLSCLRDADKVLAILKSYKLNSINLAINRARGDLIVDKKVLAPSDIVELLKTDVISILPEEDAVFLSSGISLPQKSESYKAYKIFANNLHRGSRKLFDTTNKYLGFFGSIKRGLKRSV